MRVYDFISEGGQLFSNTATYPEWLTSDMQTSVQDQLFDYALRRIQPRLIYLAEKMEIDLEDMIQAEVQRRIERNNYKYVTLLATESFEYNPIENYNMSESESGSMDKGQQIDTTLHGHQLQRTHANSDTTTHADTDTLTLNTTEGKQSAAHITGSSSSTEGARSDSTTKSMYGYNSTDGVPADTEGFSKGSQQNSATSGSDSTGSETIMRSGTEATAHTGTITDAHTGTITDANSGTDTMTSGTRKDTHARTLTRSGNIGVTTSQQMIMSEREVADFSFLKILTEDLVNCFTLGVM